MKEIPQGAQVYKSTKVFDQDTIPKGILNDHKTMKGVWGKIVIVKGKLRYVIQTDPIEEVVLSPDKYGVVEPEVLHHVRPIDQVQFFVEFLKID